MSWFSGPKPPVVVAIDDATSEGHSIEDLGAHLTICDMINESEDAARDAARCLKKKLEQRNAATLVKALAVLETCVKNCNKRFHVYIAEKSFVAALDRFVTGKHAAGGFAREKALGLIQTWADAFRHDMLLGSIRELYLKLLGEGVEFPAQNLDEVVPIVTPKISSTLMQAQPSADATGAGAGGSGSRGLGGGGGVGGGFGGGGGRGGNVGASAQRSAVGVCAGGAGGGPATPADDEALARELDRQFRAEEAAAAAAARTVATRSPVVRQPAQAPPPVGTTHGPSGGRSGSGRAATRTVYKVQELAPGQRVMATPTQLTKLRADLAIVRQNAKLLTELLRGLGPTERARDNELISEVAQTCGAMQVRVTELCDRVENEDLIVELLAANDELNDAQRELRLRTSQEAPEGAAGESAAIDAAGPAGAGDYSAWLPGGQSQTSSMPSTNVSSAAVPTALQMPSREAPRPPGGAPAGDGDDTFDMFAQARGMSMGDRLRDGPGYVTGQEGTLDDHGTFSSTYDSSLGAAMYRHMGSGQDDAAGHEPAYMEITPTSQFAGAGRSAWVGPLQPSETTGEPFYAEIEPDQPSPVHFVELPGQVGESGSPEAPPPAEPVLYDAGAARSLSEAERRRLEREQDKMFGL